MKENAKRFCIFCVQVPAGLLLSGSVCVLHHQRIWKEFWGRSLHSGNTHVTSFISRCLKSDSFQVGQSTTGGPCGHRTSGLCSEVSPTAQVWFRLGCGQRGGELEIHHVDQSLAPLKATLTDLYPFKQGGPQNGKLVIGTGLYDDCLTGSGDHRGVWGGVHGEDLGSWLLLSLQRMARTTQICPKTLLCHW